MKILVLFVLLILALDAKVFAVIVGINKYKNDDKNDDKKRLYGAVADAKAYKKILLLAGAKEKNVIMLLDENATKSNIKNALRKTVKRVQKGDIFYYYHSGHGSSIVNLKNNENKYKKLKKTAILIPYDFNQYLLKSVIVTQTDLRPYFEEIDKKVAMALLVFDACYAGYAYRGSGDELKSGFLKPKTLELNNFSKADINKVLQQNKIEYPYKHTYALMSSDAIHTSEDNRETKRGVFTNIFENCILSEYSFSIQEIKNCLDTHYITSNHIYKFVAPARTSEEKKLFHIKVKDLDKNKIVVSTRDRSLQNIGTFIKVVNPKEAYDLSIERNSNGYKLLSSSGEKIGIFSDRKELQKYLNNYRVVNIKDKSSNNFNITVKDKSGKDLSYLEVDKDYTLNVNVSHGGYLALFSLGQSGNLYLLGFDKANPNESLKMEITATAPSGTEYLKAFLLKADNRSLSNLYTNGENGMIDKNKISVNRILKIINSNSFSSATKIVRTVTRRQ